MELGYLIVKILQKHSSELATNTTHPMTLAEIQQRACAIYDGPLKKYYREYIKTDIPSRKMVQTALDSLISLELNMPDEEKTIMYREYGKEDSPRKTDYWFKNPLRDSDLRFFVDTALYSGILNEEHTRRLVKSVKGISGKNLDMMTSYSGAFGGARYTQNIDVLNNAEIISNAIERKKKIKFKLNIYNIKKELEVYQECIINPFYVVMSSNGKYYLLGTYDGNSDKIYFFRIDLMTNLKIKNEKAEDRSNVTEIKNGINLSEYYNQHPYMFGGKTSRMRLRVNKSIFTQIIDWFGYNVEVHEESETDTTIDVTVRVVEKSMHYWLLQYGESVRAINVSAEFAEKMRTAVKIIYRNYSDDENGEE